jgi:hypothetical protein
MAMTFRKEGQVALYQALVDVPIKVDVGQKYLADSHKWHQSLIARMESS